eukprot:g5988.t1
MFQLWLATGAALLHFVTATTVPSDSTDHRLCYVNLCGATGGTQKNGFRGSSVRFADAGFEAEFAREILACCRNVHHSPTIPPSSSSEASAFVPKLKDFFVFFRLGPTELSSCADYPGTPPTTEEDWQQFVRDPTLLSLPNVVFLEEDEIWGAKMILSSDTSLKEAERYAERYAELLSGLLYIASGVADPFVWQGNYTGRYAERYAELALMDLYTFSGVDNRSTTAPERYAERYAELALMDLYTFSGVDNRSDRQIAEHFLQDLFRFDPGAGAVGESESFGSGLAAALRLVGADAEARADVADSGSRGKNSETEHNKFLAGILTGILEENHLTGFPLEREFAARECGRTVREVVFGTSSEEQLPDDVALSEALAAMLTERILPALREKQPWVASLLRYPTRGWHLQKKSPSTEINTATPPLGADSETTGSGPAYTTVSLKSVYDDPAPDKVPLSVFALQYLLDMYLQDKIVLHAEKDPAWQLCLYESLEAVMAARKVPGLLKLVGGAHYTGDGIGLGGSNSTFPSLLKTALQRSFVSLKWMSVRSSAEVVSKLQEGHAALNATNVFDYLWPGPRLSEHSPLIYMFNVAEALLADLTRSCGRNALLADVILRRLAFELDQTFWHRCTAEDHCVERIHSTDEANALYTSWNLLFSMGACDKIGAKLLLPSVFVAENPEEFMPRRMAALRLTMYRVFMRQADFYGSLEDEHANVVGDEEDVVGDTTEVPSSANTGADRTGQEPDAAGRYGNQARPRGRKSKATSSQMEDKNKSEPKSKTANSSRNRSRNGDRRTTAGSRASGKAKVRNKTFFSCRGSGGRCLRPESSVLGGADEVYKGWVVFWEIHNARMARSWGRRANMELRKLRKVKGQTGTAEQVEVDEDEQKLIEPTRVKVVEESLFSYASWFRLMLNLPKGEEIWQRGQILHEAWSAQQVVGKVVAFAIEWANWWWGGSVGQVAENNAQHRVVREKVEAAKRKLAAEYRERMGKYKAGVEESRSEQEMGKEVGEGQEADPMENEATAKEEA